MAPRVAYFTAGTVGAGHFVRAAAIARGLARAGFTGTLRAFGTAPPFAAPHLPPWTVVPVEPGGLRTPEAAEQSLLASELRAFDPDLVLVDLFWAPVRHVLPLLRAEAWLLVRSCPAAWFEGPPTMRYEPRVFRRVLAIEPCELPVRAERLDPIVICSRDERRPPGALRELLGVAAGAPLSVAVHAGQPGELVELLRAADEGTRALDLSRPDAPFPAAEWLGGADRIHAGAGYNTFWELQFLGDASRTRFHPFARRIDDQAWRVRACLGLRPDANGADTLARRVLAGGG